MRGEGRNENVLEDPEEDEDFPPLPRQLLHQTERAKRGKSRDERVDSEVLLRQKFGLLNVVLPDRCGM